VPQEDKLGKAASMVSDERRRDISSPPGLGVTIGFPAMRNRSYRAPAVSSASDRRRGCGPGRRSRSRPINGDSGRIRRVGAAREGRRPHSRSPCIHFQARMACF
jgi:hypothetical protein